MGYTSFIIEKIEWVDESAGGESQAIIDLPDYLVLSGPAGPSARARAEWEADWDLEIREILERTYGCQVHKIGGYRPA